MEKLPESILPPMPVVEVEEEETPAPVAPVIETAEPLTAPPVTKREARESARVNTRMLLNRTEKLLRRVKHEGTKPALVNEATEALNEALDALARQNPDAAEISALIREFPEFGKILNVAK